MAGRKESGTQRQKRIQREQHRPEQNEGYDEAVRQGGHVPPDDSQSVSYLPPEPPEGLGALPPTAVDEIEADKAVAQVRRHEHSAD